MDEEDLSVVIMYNGCLMAFGFLLNMDCRLYRHRAILKAAARGVGASANLVLKAV